MLFIFPGIWEVIKNKKGRGCVWGFWSIWIADTKNEMMLMCLGVWRA